MARPLKKAIVLPALAALLSEVRRLSASEGFTLSHPRDLEVHDRAAIERTPSASFCWILAEHGTHLVFVDGGDIDGAHHKAWQYPAMVSEAYGPKGLRFYFWNGVALETLASADAARDRTIKEVRFRMLRNVQKCPADAAEYTSLVNALRAFDREHGTEGIEFSERD